MIIDCIDNSWFKLNCFIDGLLLIKQKSQMQGLKRKRRCQIECKDHLFVIQCLKPNSSKYDTKLLFCPKFQRDPLPPQFIHPQYNLDFKYYTSAFILGVDKRVLLKNEQQEIMDHQKQIRDSLEKHNQLIFPRPNSKHTHCSVCKEHYKNYYFHISTQEHRQKISSSLYNFHIKQLCRIYSHLWEGSEQKADEQAERMALEQEQRRQRISEVVEDDEQQSSLLDVQRGEINQFFEEGQEQVERSTKKLSRPLSINDDTVPLRSNKRSAPSVRTYQSEYLRKKFHFNNMATSDRYRQEKLYERERQKLKADTQFNHQELIKIQQKQGDTFVIMKASYAVAQGHGQFVWKRRSKITKEIEKNIIHLQNREEKQFSPQRQNNIIQVYFDKQAETEKKIVVQKKQQQADPKSYKYSHYPPYSHSTQNYKVENHYGSKSHHQYRHVPQTKSHMEPYKPPYYYNPYMPYDQYPREKPYQYGSKDKERHKAGQKEYDYPMPYQWPPYHHPYYMPPATPQTHPPGLHDQPPIPNTKTHPNQLGTSYPAGNTNININFPMYMYPPPTSYPSSNPHPQMHHPYGGYQYPYGPPSHQPNHPNPTSRQPNHPGYSASHGYPHYKQQARTNNQSKPQPSHQNFPYMHHYPPYQYPPAPPQFPLAQPQNNTLSKF